MNSLSLVHLGVSDFAVQSAQSAAQHESGPYWAFLGFDSSESFRVMSARERLFECWLSWDFHVFHLLLCNKYGFVLAGPVAKRLGVGKWKLGTKNFVYVE